MKIFLWFSVSFLFWLTAGAQTQVVYVGTLPKAEADSKFFNYAREWLKSCPKCELVDRTPYSEKTAEVEREKIPGIIDGLAGDGVLILNFNQRAIDSTKVLSESLVRLTERNWVLVGPSGHPPEGEPAAPLSRTVLGQVPNAIIIGERNQRDRLFGIGYFGPEMLTAIRMPKDLMGQDLAAVFFGTKLASAWSKKKNASDWLGFFKNKKSSTRKLWLDAEDFFGR